MQYASSQQAEWKYHIKLWVISVELHAGLICLINSLVRKYLAQKTSTDLLLMAIEDSTGFSKSKVDVLIFLVHKVQHNKNYLKKIATTMS